MIGFLVSLGIYCILFFVVRKLTEGVVDAGVVVGAFALFAFIKTASFFMNTWWGNAVQAFDSHAPPGPANQTVSRSFVSIVTLLACIVTLSVLCYEILNGRLSLKDPLGWIPHLVNAANSQNESTTATPTPRGWPKPDHIFVIVLAPNSYEAVMRVSYFSQLATQGALLTNYSAVGYPAQTNTTAMLAGEVLVSDDNVHDVSATNLVDLLEAQHLPWKAYIENYPLRCSDVTVSGAIATGQYVRSRNPFISFSNINTEPARCDRLVNARQLDADIDGHDLPAFSIYVPNTKHDGTGTSPEQAAVWLKSFLEPKQRDPGFIDKTMVVVTFAAGNQFSDNHVYTLLLGNMVRGGSQDATSYNHYSLLRSVEDNFGLGSLKRNDASATPFAACNFSVGCNE